MSKDLKALKAGEQYDEHTGQHNNVEGGAIESTQLFVVHFGSPNSG